MLKLARASDVKIYTVGTLESDVARNDAITNCVVNSEVVSVRNLFYFVDGDLGPTGLANPLT